MKFIKNAWYVVSWSETLVPGKPVAIRLMGNPIVLFRTASGKAVALVDRCSHRFAPLSKGKCEGESIRCMYHGLRFEADGACSEIPGQDIIPPQSRVQSFPIAERHGWVYVWPGDVNAASESLLPPVIGPSDGDYLLGTGTLDYKAPANLIWDNLLDFSHLGYVHVNSFNATDTWGETRPVFTKLATGVRADRWVLDQPPLFGDQRSDQWFTYDFIAPGYLLLKTLTFPVGTANACGLKDPPETGWIQNSYSAHAITPLDENNSRYFFTFGPHRVGATIEMRDAFVQVAYSAFAEDQAMIEAQAVAMNENPGLKAMPTSADRGITMFHLLTDRLIKEEAKDSAIAEVE